MSSPGLFTQIHEIMTQHYTGRWEMNWADYLEIAVRVENVEEARELLRAKCSRIEKTGTTLHVWDCTVGVYKLR